MESDSEDKKENSQDMESEDVELIPERSLNLLDTNIKYAIDSQKGMTKSYLTDLIDLMSRKDGESDDDDSNSSDEERKIPIYMLKIIRGILKAALNNEYKLSYEFLLEFIDNIE
jgi:hypothetical protein